MGTVHRGDQLIIDILLDSDASDSEVAAVMDVAREEGIESSVQANYFRKSLGELPWVIFLSVQVGVFFSAFLKAAGQEAGRDAYLGIRRLVSRLYNARRNSNGSVVLLDDNTRTHITLNADLPEEAYKQLAQIDPEQLKGGYWTWDFDQKKWSQS